MRRIALLCLMVTTTVTYGQNVLAVKMRGQPLLYTDAGRAIGCGLRIVGVVEPVAGQNVYRSFDSSANMYLHDAALGKVIGEVHSATDANPAHGRRQTLFGVWFRPEGGEPVAPIGTGFTPSTSDKGAYVFRTSFDATMGFLLGAVQGKAIQIGIKWNRTTEAIYSGTVELTDDERRELSGCFVQVLR